MRITIICVGKLKERYWQEAVAEYRKRLGAYCKIEIVEVPDERTPDKASEAVDLSIKNKEGLRIQKVMKEDAYTIALAVEGKMQDSIQLSQFIDQLGVTGNSHIQFLIGGSLGLSKEVLTKADYKLSFSKMTFPHQMMRVILLEQIYRSYRIIKKEPYHK